MVKLGAVVLVALSSGLAFAQPAPAVQEPPPAAPYAPPAPYPPPGSYPAPGAVPAPYAYQPVQLSYEDQQLLAEGEMPIMQHAGGGAVAFVIGFGTGHIVQGRWQDTGWIFTLTEGASLAAVIYGASRWDVNCTDTGATCSNSGPATLIVAGLIGMAGFHVWEVLDAFIVPANRNRRVRELRARLGLPPTQRPYSLYVTPHANDGGGTAGLVLRF